MTPPEARHNAAQESEDVGESAPDPWAFRIATISGIPLRIHITFLLLVIYLAVQSIGRGGGGALTFLSLFGLFASVTLHELGHSRVAQKFRYPVHDITLYPIGGVASIEGSPRPRHELYIAVAGPIVSALLALFFAGIVVLQGGLQILTAVVEYPAFASHYLANSPLLGLCYANTMLVLFNLLPAFPMDGGRVLRALLGLKMGKRKATLIAGRIGQGIALLMALAGLGVIGTRPSYGLVFIDVFVFFGAAQEMALELGRRNGGRVRTLE